jgi:mevalonate kinase
MALLWSGSTHVTYENTDVQRDYDLVEQAGRLAREAVLPGQQSIHKLAEAVGVSYQMQLQEGMEPLPQHGELAKKYCGGGWGGYAVYLFDSQEQRDVFLQLEGSKSIEPYIDS